jgi:hypothetical protein
MTVDGNRRVQHLQWQHAWSPHSICIGLSCGGLTFVRADSHSGGSPMIFSEHLFEIGARLFKKGPPGGVALL